LPFFSWTIDSRRNLNTESLLGHLRPVAQARLFKPKVFKAIEDKPASEDEAGDSGIDLGDDDRDIDIDGSPLDGEVGCCEPDELSHNEVALLEDASVAELVAERLEDFGEIRGLSDRTALIREALDEVVADGGVDVGVAAPVAAEVMVDHLLDVDPTACERAFNTWFQAFRLSMQAGAKRDTELQLGPKARKLQQSNASLLLRDVKGTLVTSFIHWPVTVKLKPGLIGREVLVDDGKLCFSVPALFPAISFKSKHDPLGQPYVIVLADAGVRMEQVKKADRPAVPAASLRLREMYDVAISRNTVGAEVSDPHVVPCFLCEGLAEPLAQCPVCLCTAHGSCLPAIHTWSQTGGHGSDELAVVARVSFPPMFMRSMCLLCERSELLHFSDSG
jgi:hypothetical protein